MNSLIILFSYHHKNTEKIAQVIAKVIGAEIKTPEQTDPNTLANYDLVGFGSGVYFGKLGKALLELADKIPKPQARKRSFSPQAAEQEKQQPNSISHSKRNLKLKGFRLLANLIAQVLTLSGFSKSSAA